MDMTEATIRIEFNTGDQVQALNELNRIVSNIENWSSDIIEDVYIEEYPTATGEA